MIKKQYPILFSSDPTDGAVRISQNGSTFSVDLNNEEIIIPANAQNCNIFIQESEFIYNFPNIIQGVNDRITISYVKNAVTNIYNLVIPQGLYSVNDLNTQVQIELYNQMGYDEAAPLIELLGSDPQQKVLIKYNFDAVSVDLTGINTFRDIIGFNSGIYTGDKDTFITAQNVAQFNTVRYVLLSCDLVDNGLRVGNRYDFYVCRMLIDVAVGEQQLYRPLIRSMIPASNLIGKRLSSTTLRLLDQSGVELNTNGEYYSLNLIIEFEVPI
jgi:hypothetical protein